MDAWAPIWRFLSALTPKQVGLAVVAVSLLGGLSMVAMLVEKHRMEGVNARVAEQEQQRAEAARSEAQAREDALRATLPDVLAGLQADLVSMDAALARGDRSGAATVDQSWHAAIAPFQGHSVMNDVAPYVVELRCRESQLGMPAHFDEYDAAVRGHDYQAAESAMLEVTEAAKVIQATCANYTAMDAVTTMSGRATRNLAKVAPKAQASRDEETRRKQEADQLRETCGAKPELSGWDGGLFAATQSLKESAHDPDSISVTECTIPVLTKTCWMTKCKVRGRNAFGGMILTIMRFYVAGGKSGSSMDTIILGSETVE